jgi:hypothetical protein
MRLCPKHQGWETLEAAADTYIQTNKINPNALLDENHPVEENCDEVAAGGATPPDWDPPSSDEEYIKVDPADELFRLGTPTNDRYWISEQEVVNGLPSAGGGTHETVVPIHMKLLRLTT